MKKIATLVLLASAAIASPAFAQATGTITLTGTVGDKCTVVGTAIGGNVDFLALDTGAGTLRSGLDTDFGTKTFTVKCTSANPTISVTALPLATGAAAGTGYDNSIDYSATVTVDKATTGTTAVTDSSTVAAATTGQVGARLANSTGNVRVTAGSFATNANTDLLVSGTYNGSIAITISPTN